MKASEKKLAVAALALAVGLVSDAAEQNIATNDLTTAWGRAVTPENAWREYPRPQLVRGEWTCLNGLWDYAIVSAAALDEPTKYDGKILVPFAVETPLSGVKRKVTPEDQIWYRRSFTVHPRKGCRTILNFEKVDFRAHVFVNGVEATDVPHAGGNVPFSVDVTKFVKDGENELKLLVWDPTDTHLGGTGKQVLNLRTCFFPATSGICGSVWMETVPETYIADYRVDTDIDKGEVTLTFNVANPRYGDNECGIVEICKQPLFNVELSRTGATMDNSAIPQFHNSTIPQSFRPGEPCTIKMPKGFKLWSPDSPNLYDFRAKFGKDEIRGYFGMRKVSTALDAKGVRRVTVNGKFTYLLATLDQGWWPDGYLTPPSEDAMRYDVDLHKRIGFNAVRKHIKVEPRLFYAHCDRVGLMVMQDIPSHRADDKQGSRDIGNRNYGFYRRELKDVVDLLRNHPSVVVWIPFNEAWGQPSYDKTRMVNLWLRRYDPSRLVDGPSGWNDHEGGEFMAAYVPKWVRQRTELPETPSADIVDKHHYPEAMMFPPNAKRVTLAGEFGCAVAKLEGHYMDPMGREHRLTPVSAKGWRGRWRRDYEKLARPLVKMAYDGLGGSVYTEIADQFWEGCGFVTFDRAVEKFDAAFLRGLHKEILGAARAGAEGRPLGNEKPGNGIQGK